MTQPTRTLQELIDAGAIVPAPMQATLEQLAEIDKRAEPLTVHGVDMEETEEFGVHWTLSVERPTGERLLIGLWANAQRDDTLKGLMEVTPGGPVGGVRLVNAGTGKKPFWLVTTA